MKIVSFDEFVEKKCKNCINKYSDLCEIKRIMDSSVNCVYYDCQNTKEKEE
jgi:hypothetical protein